MSLEKQQQKNTEQKKPHIQLNLNYVDYENVYGPYIFKFNLNTMPYKPMIVIYKWTL